MMKNKVTLLRLIQGPRVGALLAKLSLGVLAVLTRLLGLELRIAIISHQTF